MHNSYFVYSFPFFLDLLINQNVNDIFIICSPLIIVYYYGCLNLIQTYFHFQLAIILACVYDLIFFSSIKKKIPTHMNVVPEAFL